MVRVTTFRDVPIGVEFRVEGIRYRRVEPVLRDFRWPFNAIRIDAVHAIGGVELSDKVFVFDPSPVEVVKSE